MGYFPFLCWQSASPKPGTTAVKNEQNTAAVRGIRRPGALYLSRPRRDFKEGLASIRCVGEVRELRAEKRAVSVVWAKPASRQHDMKSTNRRELYGSWVPPLKRSIFDLEMLLLCQDTGRPLLGLGLEWQHLGLVFVLMRGEIGSSRCGFTQQFNSISRAVVCQALLSPWECVNKTY